MRLIFGLTGAFALGVSIFSKTGFPEPSSYVLSITDRDPRAPTKVQILANRLTGPDACVEAFAARNRSLHPATMALCTPRDNPHRGTKIIETQNAQGNTLYEEYPFPETTTP